MKCLGSHYAGSIMAEEVESAEAKANAEKICGSEDWELLWSQSLNMEEGTPVYMYQCRECKRIVMAGDEYRYSDKWA